jgi:hypothetical protein
MWGLLGFILFAPIVYTLILCIFCVLIGETS